MEEVGAIDFPFEFKDHDDEVHIKLKMEKLTIAQLDVYVIPSKEPNNDVSKRLRLEPSIVFDSVDTMHLGPQEEELLYNLNNFAFCPQPIGSKVSDSTEVVELTVSDMKSSTLTPEVLKIYFKEEEDLIGEFKSISLEDHERNPKSWDQDGISIVKLYHQECTSGLLVNNPHH